MRHKRHNNSKTIVRKRCFFLSLTVYSKYMEMKNYHKNEIMNVINIKMTYIFEYLNIKNNKKGLK